MVKSHARKLVPGWNLSGLLQAFNKASWTRSSAKTTDPQSDIAKARRPGISATNSSLKLLGLIVAASQLRFALFGLQLI